MVRDMASIDEFSNVVKDNIGKYLGDISADLEVSINKVAKNNATLTGITIKPKSASMAPNIYLEEFYKDYMSGKDMDLVLGSIADLARQHIENLPVVDLDMINDKNKVLANVLPKVICTKGNENLFADKPHTELADMTTIYYVPLDEAGTMTVTLTDNHINNLNLDVKDLHDAASKNIIGKMRVATMTEIIAEMMGMPVEAVRAMNGGAPEQYVVTTGNKFYGAGILASTDALDKAVEEINPNGSPVYILPSSVHEILILNSESDFEISELENMVREVNDTQVAPGERLTYSVYVYDPSTKELSIADGRERDLD